MPTCNAEQTFGNHEFDHGPGLAAQFAANLTELGIPVLACNLDVSKEPAFDGVELQVGWPGFGGSVTVVW